MLNHHFPNETLFKNWSRPHSWTHPEYHISGDIPIVYPIISHEQFHNLKSSICRSWGRTCRGPRLEWCHCFGGRPLSQSRGPKGWFFFWGSKVEWQLDDKENMSIQIYPNQASTLAFFFHGKKNNWVCLKMGYTPNYSHLVGIMIINHWV